MISKKFRSRLGMTLAETLTALAVFAILSVALVVGTTAAWKVYQKGVVAGEARTLQSTLTQSLSDELRYARNISVVGETVVFDSETFGLGVSVSSTDGRIKIGTKDKNYDLLPEKAYTNGLNANVDKIEYANGIFTVTMTVSHKLLTDEKRTSTFTVRALNSSVDVPKISQ